MSRNPLNLGLLPLDSDHPLPDNNDNDRSKSSTHPILSDGSR